MKLYPAYKDSGMEWIGEIPDTWEFGEMKYQLSNNDGGVWGKDIESDDEGTIVIRSTEITIDGKWDLSNPMKRKLDEGEIEKCKLYEGDIVITKSSGSPDHIGKSVIVSEEIEIITKFRGTPAVETAKLYWFNLKHFSDLQPSEHED